MNLKLSPWFLNPAVFSLFISVVLALEFFSIHGNCGLNLVDEGYFWYGVERVFQGDVPIRDFHAYDPGRYYWSALWFHLWRPGLVPLRFSEALFQIFGIFAGLMALQPFIPNRWVLAGIGLLLGLWMFPDYKYFDCVIPLAAVYIGYRLLESPWPRMAWIAGAFVGLAYFFGRNHGLYLFVSFAILIIVKSFQTKDWKRWGLGGLLGLLTGFLPLLLMFVFARDFARSYFDFIFRFGAAILPLPMPWFWKINLFSIFQPGALPVILFGFLFNLALFFYLFWAYRFFKNRKSPQSMDDFLLACSLVGLPYFHYMIHHADLEHLAVFSPRSGLDFLSGYPFPNSNWESF